MANILNCTKDFDCPGAQLCYKNVTWSVYNTSFCACNTYYGFAGEEANCSEKAPTFYYLVTFLGFETFVSTLFALVAFYDAFLILRLFGLKKRPNSTIVTTISTPLALLFFLCWRALYLASTLSPQDATVSFDHGIKRQNFGTVDAKFAKFEVVQRPFIFLTYLFMIISAGSLSLVWISLSQRVESMREFNAFEAWRNWIILFMFCFCVCMGVIVIFGAFEFTSMVTLPFLLLIMFSFGYGRSRMLDLLRRAIEFGQSNWSTSSDSEPAGFQRDRNSQDRQRSNTGGSSGGKVAYRRKTEAWSREKSAMLAISRVSSRSMASIACIFLCGFAHFWLHALHPEGWREFAPSGKISTVTVVSDLEALFILFLLVSIVFYMHRNTGNLVRTHKIEKLRAVPTAEDSACNYEGRRTVAPSLMASSSSFSDIFPRRESSPSFSVVASRKNSDDSFV